MTVIFVVIYFALFALVLYRARSPVTSDSSQANEPVSGFATDVALRDNYIIVTSGSIPTPGKMSGIPTPGRFRSAYNVTLQLANDPAQHCASFTHNTSSSSSCLKSTISASQSGRWSLLGRPFSVAFAPPTRTKIPPARPPSRQPDAFPPVIQRNRGSTCDITQQ
ncbi:hypothetical protein V8E55_010458 [Tylopilus felleus]